MNIDYFRFCPTLVKLMNEGAATGASGRYHTDVIVSSMNNLRLLRELVLELKPVNTLEIGLAFGGSALTFLTTLKEIWPSGEFSHSAIDPFQITWWDSIAVEAIKKEGLEGHFTLLDDFSCYVLPSMVKQKRQFGLVYVDGSHLFEDVFMDMFFVSKLLPESGVVVFDDCRDRHVAKVLKFAKRNFNQILVEMDLSRYGGQKPFLKRMANFLGYRQARGFVKKDTGKRNWGSPFVPF